MKIRVSLKDPDSMPDAVIDACHAQTKEIDALSREEQQSLAVERSCEFQHEIAKRWMPYGEYLYVEFDTDDWTATVLPAKEHK